MLINEIKDRRGYLYTERYVNTFKKVSNEVSKEYCAIEGKKNFLIPHIEVPLKEVKLFLSSPSKEIYEKIISKGKVKFFIHPETLRELNINGLKSDTFVEPTSSTRTVVPKDENFAIKLHLNKRLSKYIRRLSESSVEHSILISKEIEKSIKKCPFSFGYLPESIGVTYKDIGMIIRELTPRPFVKDDRILIPLFSLYSQDLKNNHDESFFCQLVKINKENPLNYFIDKILTPLFVNISFFINEYGLLLEPHGQNVLVEFDKDFRITRFIHRDFQSMYVDTEIRKKKNLSIPFKKHLMGVECPKEVSYGLVYDHFMGKYVFDNFVELLKKKYNIPKNKTKKEIKRTFVRYFDLESFPKKSFYLMKKKTFTDNNTELKKYYYSPAYRP